MATGRLDSETLDLLIGNLERNRGPLDPVHRSVIHNINQNEYLSTHPYRDTNGHATIGFGMLITPERNYEYSQPDYPAGSGSVSPAKVETELAVLRRRPYGKKHEASEFESDTTLRWTPDYAMNRLYDHLRQDHAALRQHFPRFDAFPDAAKQAIFDLAWQMGGGIFGDSVTRRDPKRNKMWMDLSNAIGNQDWATAALLVPELPGKERNPWRIGRFLDAAIEANMDYPGPQPRPSQRTSLYGPGGYPGYAPTLEELDAMSNEDFDRNWDRVMLAHRGR